MSIESDNVLIEELALRLWGGKVGWSIHDKAEELLPWLLGVQAQAYARGYREALARVSAHIATLERSITLPAQPKMPDPDAGSTVPE